jgi:hypothetical protein
MIKLEGTSIPPDATGTLRLSFGAVRAYDAKPLVDSGRGSRLCSPHARSDEGRLCPGVHFRREGSSLDEILGRK